MVNTPSWNLPVLNTSACVLVAASSLLALACQNQHTKGVDSATCSEACAKEHIKNTGRQYYERIKGTAKYKEMHARSVESFKKRQQSDPEYAAIWSAYYRHMSFLRSRLINQDPTKRKNRLEYQRENNRGRRHRIETDPMGWEVLKFKSRRWYQALSPQDKERIYIKPRRERRRTQNKSE